MIEETYERKKQARQRQDDEFQDRLEGALEKFEAFLFAKGESLQGAGLRNSPEAYAKRHRRIANFSREALVVRGLEAISREISQLDSEVVDRLLKSSDPKLLVGLARVSLDDTPVDRVERLTLKGAERFQSLIEDAGGSVSSSWVSQLLGISEEAVRKRAQRGTLICRRTASGGLSFPRFQFDEPNKRLLDGIQVLLSQKVVWAPEELIRFLLVRYAPEHSDDTPLKMLDRGEVDRVMQIASDYLQQRA